WGSGTSTPGRRSAPRSRRPSRKGSCASTARPDLKVADRTRWAVTRGFEQQGPYHALTDDLSVAAQIADEHAANSAGTFDRMPPSLPVATRSPDRPQFATLEEAVITSVEWFVEPCWKGARLLARLENGRVRLTDQDGKPAGSELDEAARVLEDAIDAEQAVIDGSWAAMPFVGEGSPARKWAETVAGG